ncbi:beta-mannosidase [Microbacterium terrae]|uniref:beta-mannosidase n=1 Tax=Microbacterium terrae TaxID=69369 RepID=A0A0M2HFQ2_9MICO|nr:sugar-binding domain-containing protein [Microbacterium terrae]KJL45497.1 Exo-beta-D-glucosaminidase precursor [Microbacterium terrae]MBP1078450.1 beta-mannosidase [Microbacterium terrae]GLJ99350.1 beta-mannosidase [Microbacterium terrae]
MSHPQTLAGPITRRALSEGWTLSAASGPAPDDIAGLTVPAVVPGVVHTDLLAAGLIPDPYLDDNEAALAWIGLVDWTYETTFEVAADELAGAARHDLVFDGVDTVAAISLNGALLAEVANQHRSYRFDVGAHLVAGENRLTVAFRSPVRAANEQSVALGVRQRPYPLPYEAIRKSACNFGWDWGIATFTSGLWKPVRLESWSLARLAEVRVVAEPVDDGGRVRTEVRVERASDADLDVSVEVAGVRAAVVIPADEVAASVVVDAPAVDRWWPVGYGAQPLYDVAIALHVDDECIDTAARRVGFRELVWNTGAEGDASRPFQLVVNGEPVFVKGVNWIPDDALPVRVDRARYADRLTQARDANLNLIRVWGGGIYESDDFYDLCDELGLLTWQDFLFACAAYAEEEPLRSEIEAEARENVSRIAHHPSLALLTGNNENLWGYEDWGWQELLDGKTWGAYYYYDLLPGVVGEIASHVPYAPGSPFSPGGSWDGTAQTGPHPNDEAHGTMHLWEQWNREDWTTYRAYRPRFVAEFGWQGPPAWTTLTRSISDSPLTPESPGMVVHQKAMEGNVKLSRGLVKHYRIPEDMETWHWAMQLNQANAVAAALDWFRAHAPFTAGAVVWQLNDCWPVTSWAAIDGEAREKPLYFALKNSFAPRAVTVQPLEQGLSAIVANDTRESWATELVITRRRFDGTVLAEQRASVEIAPFGSAVVALEAAVAGADDAASEVVVADAAGSRGVWFFAEPRESALAPQQVTVSAAPTEDGVDVTVTAAVLVRDLTLLVDKVSADARVDSALVTLLPGESHTFRVRGALAEAEAFAAPTVLRSGNQLVSA